MLVGILRHHLETGVNFVNAPSLARERGLLVLEAVLDRADYRNGQIFARASERAGGRAHLVGGTVFGREPRFVRVDDISLDLSPKGPLLITRHHDRPGVLGQIGTLLGRHGVNIRRLELGPPEEGPQGLATGFLTLYGAPDKAVIEAIATIDAIESVELVRL
jgi:D-3-phosphoglycerate dehydrogenase